MRTKRKMERKLRSYSLSRDALSMEVKQAADFLQLSCGWAFNLSEGVADFQNSMMEIISHLEDLERTTKDDDMSSDQQKMIQSMLWRLRKYSRHMCDDSEPLSIVGIIEDLEMIEELGKLSKKVHMRISEV